MNADVIIHMGAMAVDQQAIAMSRALETRVRTAEETGEMPSTRLGVRSYPLYTGEDKSCATDRLHHPSDLANRHVVKIK